MSYNEIYSLQDIEKSIAEGKGKGATHVIIVCDRFDYTDYHRFVMPGQTVEEVIADIKTNDMQRIMDVYEVLYDENNNIYKFIKALKEL